MDLKNKKIGFLGDSITQGVGASNSENNYKGFRFSDVICDSTGAVQFNYGVSGTRIAKQTVPIEYEPAAGHFSLRVDSMENDLDVIIVFGGTNDFGHGDAPLGEMSDRTEDSFYGALHFLINKLVNKYPESILVFLTPLHRLNENQCKNWQGIRCEPLIKYVEAIREVCQYYSIPVIDLYSISGIQPEIEVVKNLYMPDGLHPSDKGAKKIAEIVVSYLKNYV